jgi:excisionase family DNA binding protein
MIRNEASEMQVTNAPSTSPALIDINALSRLLSIPRGTLYNLVYLRRIPFVKRGRSLRFDPDEVLRSMPRFDMIGSAGKR